VELTQTQAGEPFVIPVEFGISVAAGKIRVEQGEMTARTARFTFAAEQEPAMVELDPNVRLLMSGGITRR